MKCYILHFETNEGSKRFFLFIKEYFSKKAFRFKKNNENCVAVYCHGFKASTLACAISCNLQKVYSELIPDFGYYCELEKITILEMTNV